MNKRTFTYTLTAEDLRCELSLPFVEVDYHTEKKDGIVKAVSRQ